MFWCGLFYLVLVWCDLYIFGVLINVLWCDFGVIFFRVIWCYFIHVCLDSSEFVLVWFVVFLVWFGVICIFWVLINVLWCDCGVIWFKSDLV